MAPEIAALYEEIRCLVSRVSGLEAKVHESEMRIEELYIYTGKQERMKDLKAFEKYREQRG